MKRKSIVWICLLALLLGGCVAAQKAPTGAQLNTPAFSMGTSYKKLPPPPEFEDFQIDPGSAWLTLTHNRQMTATDYFVYDLNYERFLVLSGQTADRVYPASTTKLFTAWVALQYIDPAERITITTELELVDPASSVAGLQQGDTVSVEQLIAAMMLPSGNDATYILTANVGKRIGGEELSLREAVQCFVQTMNEQAQLVGLENSNFVTPDGFHHPDHLISIADMVTIAKLALENPVISQLVSQPSLTENVGSRELILNSTNLLLYQNAGYYCEYAVGLKTGYTSQAGNCLLSVFQQGDRRLLVGVFGCPNEFDRFTESLVLFAQSAGLQTPGTTPVYGTIPQ